MNYTEKYHLPQWEESDRVMRTDFNQMCADIESGIQGAAQAAANAQAKAEELPYRAGSYEGNGGRQDVITGFKPSVVLIFTGQLAKQVSLTGGNISASGPGVESKVEILDNGFRVFGKLSDTDYSYPSVNNNNCTYRYIAFR